MTSYDNDLWRIAIKLGAAVDGLEQARRLAADTAARYNDDPTLDKLAELDEHARRAHFEIYAAYRAIQNDCNRVMREKGH